MSDPTRTSIDIITSYLSPVDFLEYVVTCTESNCDLEGELVVPAINNDFTTISGLPPGHTFEVKLFAAVGEYHRSGGGKYNPLYTFAESTSQMFTLGTVCFFISNFCTTGCQNMGEKGIVSLKLKMIKALREVKILCCTGLFF